VLTQRQSAANATALLPVVSDAGVPAIIPAAEAGPAMRPLNIAPGRAKKCCFPFGEPRRPDFRYCDAPVYSAGVYCAEHAAICFVRVRTEATPWG
jgi:GcrA cell cycle regulator